MASGMCLSFSVWEVIDLCPCHVSLWVTHWLSVSSCPFQFCPPIFSLLSLSLSLSSKKDKNDIILWYHLCWLTKLVISTEHQGYATDVYLYYASCTHAWKRFRDREIRTPSVLLNASVTLCLYFLLSFLAWLSVYVYYFQTSAVFFISVFHCVCMVCFVRYLLFTHFILDALNLEWIGFNVRKTVFLC